MKTLIMNWNWRWWNSGRKWNFGRKWNYFTTKLNTKRRKLLFRKLLESSWLFLKLIWADKRLQIKKKRNIIIKKVNFLNRKDEWLLHNQQKMLTVARRVNLERLGKRDRVRRSLKWASTYWYWLQKGKKMF